MKKSYTCEGGAQLRISFWHLLMNLKNKYLLKTRCCGPIKNKITLKSPGDIITLHLPTEDLNDMIKVSNI